MRPARTVLAYFVKVGLVYAVFLLPFRALPDLYGASFRACGNLVFRVFGRSGRIYFEPLPGGSNKYDTRVRLKNVGRGSSGSLDMASRTMGYLPTAFLVGLILATPLRWSRRGKGLVLGLGLISLFVGLKLYLRFLNVFSDDNVLATYQFGALGKSALTVCLKVFSMSPVTSYIAPVFIWILVMFRQGDVARLHTEIYGESPRASRSHDPSR